MMRWCSFANQHVEKSKIFVVLETVKPSFQYVVGELLCSKWFRTERRRVVYRQIHMCRWTSLSNSILADGIFSQYFRTGFSCGSECIWPAAKNLGLDRAFWYGTTSCKILMNMRGLQGYITYFWTVAIWADASTANKSHNGICGQGGYLQKSSRFACYMVDGNKTYKISTFSQPWYWYRFETLGQKHCRAIIFDCGWCVWPVLLFALHLGLMDGLVFFFIYLYWGVY